MTTLLIVFFISILGLTFVGTLFAMRQSPEEKRLQERLRQAALTSVKAYDTTTLDVFQQAHEVREQSWKQQLPGLPALERLIYQAQGHRNCMPTLGMVVLLTLLGAIAGIAITRSYPPTIVGATLLGAAPLFRLKQKRTQYIKSFEAVLPDAIDLCTRALHAGHSLIAAFEMVAEQVPEPVRAEFAEVFRKQNYGLPLRDALLGMHERVPSADLRVFITGVLVQKDTGGNLTEIFDRIVQVIRERIRIAGEIRTHTAQGRMTAWVLTALPPALLLIINVIDPGYSRLMFTDPLGQRFMYTGIGLLLLGGFTVRRIVRGVEV